MAKKLSGRKEKDRQRKRGKLKKRVKCSKWRRKQKEGNEQSLIKGKQVTKMTQPTKQFYLETRAVDHLNIEWQQIGLPDTKRLTKKS